MATYVVKPGDNLSKIAQRLGLKSWQDLYNLNKSVIGSNPNFIRIGQTLNLPGSQPSKPKTAPKTTAPTQTLAESLTKADTDRQAQIAKIPQFENVLPFLDAWNQLAPNAQAAAEQQINPEATRQYNAGHRNYMNSMASSGGQRFGRGLAGVGDLRAAAERERQNMVNNWMGAQQQGFREFFYDPSRNAWNQARLQGVNPDNSLTNMPTWEDYYNKANNAYNGGSSSPFYGSPGASGTLSPMRITD